MTVRVQTEDFDVGAESRALQAETVGGIALFVGTVRGLSSDDGVTAMTLEHFPGMTESELERIETEARARWPLEDVTIIHRVGRLVPGEHRNGRHRIGAPEGGVRIRRIYNGLPQNRRALLESRRARQ